MKRTWMCAAMILTLAAPATAPAIHPTLSLQVGIPMMVSGSVGLRADGDGLQPAVALEAGIGGGRVSVGADSLGEGFGWGFKASLLRTWLEPVDVPEDQTYLGVDLELGYEVLFASIGGYVQIEGDDDDELIATLAIGIRL